jgi:hypothetical protein
MISARVDTGDQMMIRDRIRVVAWYEDGRDRVVLGRGASGGEYPFRARADGTEAEPLPEGASLYMLDARRDVAYAAYLALKEHFEPKTPVPTAADQAYHDARADLQRAHALVDKLIDVVARPPLAISGTVLTTEPT